MNLDIEEVKKLGWEQSAVISTAFSIPELLVDMIYDPGRETWEIRGQGSWYGTMFRGAIENVDCLDKLMEWTGIKSAIKELREGSSAVER